ncbi:hypothetical protein AB0J90_25240 [Micromonospora sp. NPDC049523]|uniref:hypothetical protein n=1 Tax=Micromonospora sp. NPDC049523 TaxID=3155921 RepID=UPI00341C88FC
MTSPSTVDVAHTCSDSDDLTAVHRNDERWRCVDCRREWPCPVIRRRLLVLYRREPVKLRVYLRHFQDRAATQLPELSTRQLDARFFGWIPDPPPGRRRRPA